MKILLLLFFMSITVFAADIKIPVQGYLTDSNGIALNGEQNIKFSLYNTDEDGDPIWSNQDAVTINVENGNFSYMLGTTDFIDSSIMENATPLYLGVKINDELLSPRIEIGVESKSVYSYKTEVANNALNSEKLEGKTLNELKTEVKTEIDNTKLNDILNRLDALEEKVTILETDNNNLKSRVTTLETENTALKSRTSDLENNLSSLTTLVNTIKNSVDNNTINIAQNYHDLNDADGRLQYFLNLFSDSISALELKTADMSIVNLNYDGVNYKTVRFSHVNLQIVNGTGGTEDFENGLIDGRGLGNLIIGYNELRSGVSTPQRTGIHNLIVGMKHNYTSVAGVVFGINNAIKNAYATVTGGRNNTAEGFASSVSGGYNRSTPNNNDSWRAGDLYEDQ